MDRVLSCIGRVMFASLVTDPRATAPVRSLSSIESKSTGDHLFVLLSSPGLFPLRLFVLRRDRRTHRRHRRTPTRTINTQGTRISPSVRWILYGPVLDLRPTRLGSRQRSSLGSKRGLLIVPSMGCAAPGPQIFRSLIGID